MPALENTAVLVLDDNPLILKLSRALMEREGATVLTAASWIEFNHVLASSSPDVMLIDINLPRIKGNRLSEVLKSQTNCNSIPVILISDLPERAIQEIFPSSGADGWLRKPLTRENVVGAIQRVLKR